MGDGFFRWPDVSTAIKEVPKNFNLIDPPLRDGSRLAKGEGSWTVIRYHITFPAISMLHCKSTVAHIYFAEGLTNSRIAMAILSAIVTFFFIDPLSHDGMEQEDIAFREYLESNGFDTSRMGLLGEEGVESGEERKVSHEDTGSEKAAV